LIQGVDPSVKMAERNAERVAKFLRGMRRETIEILFDNREARVEQVGKFGFDVFKPIAVDLRVFAGRGGWEEALPGNFAIARIRGCADLVEKLAVQ
jgi:hypothetical protein